MSTWKRGLIDEVSTDRGAPEAPLDATGLRIGIVVSRFNDTITRQLLQGAEEALLTHGATNTDIDVAWVPGAFEIPLVAKKMAQSGRYQAIVCLGAVIRGATAHFEFVAAEAAKGISNAALETGVPILFGVLTTETAEQAVERSDPATGNKGGETALAAIEMANLVRALDG